MANAYIECAPANDALQRLEPASVRLASFSPPYWNLIDYGRMAARPGDRWARTPETLPEHLAECAITCRLLWEVCAADAIVAVEIGSVRDPLLKDLAHLPTYWVTMLQDAGFRLLEDITLVRQIAPGRKARRSGHLRRHPYPGYALLDNTTSTLLIAGKGNPLERLRREGKGSVDPIELAWASRYLRTAWTVPPFRRRVPGHPVPQDQGVVRALLTFYSLPGDRVLDPFAGSGTTGKLALDLKREAVLIEREPAFVEAMRRALATAEALSRLPRTVRVAGAQLYLPLPGEVESAARRAFLRSAVSDVTDRQRAIARVVSQESGIAVSPELVALLLRAERQHYYSRAA